jgi:hypothetical protein
MMADRIASHYSENLELAGLIAEHLQSAGKNFQKLTATDLATVDEFHPRPKSDTGIGRENEFERPLARS